MTSEEARRLLRAARATGADDADPAFAEALALAQSDPELARWLAGERRADARVAESLASIPAPADLKAKILSRAKSPAQASLEKNVPFPPRAFTLRPAVYSLLVLAAVLAVAAALLFRPSYDSYEGDLAGQIACGEVTHLAHQSADVAQLEQWLAANRAPSEIAVPSGLQTVPGLGCRTFQWKGRQIGQICFALDNGKIVHLFVVRNAGWRPSTAPPQGRPQFNRHGDWTLASWRDGTTTYVVAGEGDLETVKKFL